MKYSPPVRYEVSAEHGNVWELMKCEKNLGSTRLELYKNVYGEIAIDFYPVLIQADFLSNSTATNRNITKYS